MFAFLSMLSTITQLLPMLHGLVVAVESMFPASGNGPKKLDLILNTVEGVIQASGEASHVFQELRSPIVGAINGIVATYNAAGGFPLPGSTLSHIAEVNPALAQAVMDTAAMPVDMNQVGTEP